MNDKPVYLRVKPCDVTFINKIMEGYEYLGVVSTVNREEALLKIRVTPDTRDIVLDILKHLPRSVEIIEQL